MKSYNHECIFCGNAAKKEDGSLFCDVVLPPWIVKILPVEQSKDVKDYDTCSLFEKQTEQWWDKYKRDAAWAAIGKKATK